MTAPAAEVVTTTTTVVERVTFRHMVGETLRWSFGRATPGIFWWTVSPIVDKRGEGISLTRLMAIAYTILVFHVVESTHVVGMNILWMVLAGYAVAFGKSTFTFLLTKMEMKATSSATESITANAADIIREIKGRRDPKAGVEPSP